MSSSSMPGRVIRRFNYNPASLAANTTASIISSDDVRQVSPGTMLSCRMWLAGGGEAVGANSHTASTCPAFIRLRAFSGESSAPGAYADYWPMPGSADNGGSDGPADHTEIILASAYYQFPIPNIPSSADSSGYGWELDIRNSAGTSQPACSIANGNPIIVRGEIVTGHLPSAGEGQLVAVPTAAYGLANQRLVSFNSKRARGIAGSIAPGMFFTVSNEGATTISYFAYHAQQHDFFGSDGDALLDTLLISGNISAGASTTDELDRGTIYSKFNVSAHSGATFDADELELLFCFSY